ncbi:MAG: hypothetical protein RL026_2808 [Pseudomonadota bacterium]
MNSAAAPRLPVTRDVLADTWDLFQRSWLTCLPMALVGVAASSVPGTEAAADATVVHDRQWWALYVVSVLLTLTTYGAVSIHQWRRVTATETAPGLLEALRLSVRRLPAAGATAILVTLATLLGLAVLVLPGLAAGVWLSLAYMAALNERLPPLAACRRSVSLVRGRFWLVAKVLLVAFMAVLVFVILAPILFNIVVSVGGTTLLATAPGLWFSRLMFSLLLALPVVYVSALLVSLYRRLAAAD